MAVFCCLCGWATGGLAEQLPTFSRITEAGLASQLARGQSCLSGSYDETGMGRKDAGHLEKSVSRRSQRVAGHF